ncbi:WXG100 family type VII secretion target [Nocardia alni]|uniref:WXG100 family type VII secretion target n=1 Tax=Nocardia alni TaxID=2815723 RepID=UPI001C23B6F8|nr:WXG100 family type VII secretion target [Nocardia alni]
MGQENSGDLVVVPEELRATARAIKNLLGNISTGFGSLNRDVTSLLDNWKGPAGSSFDVAWGELRSGVKDLVEAIGTMESSLDQTAREYLDQDDAGAAAIDRTIRSLGSSLNL